LHFSQRRDKSGTLLSENMNSSFNEEEMQDTCAKRIHDNCKDRVTMEQMNKLSQNIVKTPRKTNNINDFEFQVEESNNRKSILR